MCRRIITSGKRRGTGNYTRHRMARMTKHIFPTLGDRDTATITPRDIFSAVNPIWGKLQTAPRMLDEISAVIGQAMAVDERRFQRGNPAPITRKMLKQGVSRTLNHMAPCLGNRPLPCMPSRRPATIRRRMRCGSGCCAARHAPMKFLVLCGRKLRRTPSVGNRLDRNWTKLREPQAHFTIPGHPRGYCNYTYLSI
jgi:hypothetical protein